MRFAPLHRMRGETPHDLHFQSLHIAPELKKILARPLIVGASVSTNHRGIQSPGLQLALRATTTDAIRTIGRSGRPAASVLKLLQEDDLRDRTCVIGIDLLFWDSTLASPNETFREFRKFTQLVMRRELPIAVGEVPGFFPPMQPQWKAMNREIRRFEKEYEKCVVLPFDSIYHQILEAGLLVHQEVKYSIQELIPDGLHLSSLAGKVLADCLQEEWRKNLLASTSLAAVQKRSARNGHHDSEETN